jgi:glutamate racemase
MAEVTIGVFDSGVGGLTVARTVLRARPGARLLYLADTAHVPYGGRPLAQIRDFALQIIDFLFAQGADAVVMGCNMSAAAGADEAARARFDRPVFAVVDPGSRAARAVTRGVVGVIATQGTVTSGIYGRTLRALGVDAVHEQACPAFVPLVERGLDDGPEVEAAVAEYLTPLRDAGIDTLVFGCTHYPFLRAPIARFLGPGVALVDPADLLAADVAARFPAAAPTAAPHRFFASGSPDSLLREGPRLLGLPIAAVERVDVPVERVETPDMV